MNITGRRWGQLGTPLSLPRMPSLSLIRSFLSEDQFQCSICLDVFTNPASTPCGHSFCMSCISRCWDAASLCICPLCNETFRERPDLQINRTLREITDQFKEMTGGSRKAGGGGKYHRLAGGDEEEEEEEEEEVEGSIPIPASPSILLPPPNPFTSPLASSFPDHRPLSGSPRPVPLMSRSCTRRRFTVSGAGDSQRVPVCQRHQRGLLVYCRTDGACICPQCEKTDHCGHETLSVEKHWMESQAQLSVTEMEVKELMKERKNKIEEIRANLEELTSAADRETVGSMCVFSAFVSAVQRSQSELLDTIETRRRAAEQQADAAIGRLEQEVAELRKRCHTLSELSQSEDYVHCIKTFSSLSSLPPIRESPGLSVTSDLNATPVYRSLSVIVDKFRKDLKQMEEIGFPPDPSVPRREPRTKKIQEYAVQVTLDSNTAHPRLILSEDRKLVKCGEKLQPVPDNPERFDRMVCVLGQETFCSGRHYWEVEVGGKTDWDLGVASSSVHRKGKIDVTPSNGYWFLSLRDKNKLGFRSDASASLLRRIGIYLDYDKGQVSFYNVDSKQHIYTFLDSFKDGVRPFFSPCTNKSGKNNGPLVITTLG